MPSDLPCSADRVPTSRRRRRAWHATGWMNPHQPVAAPPAALLLRDGATLCGLAAGSITYRSFGRPSGDPPGEAEIFVVPEPWHRHVGRRRDSLPRHARPLEACHVTRASRSALIAGAIAAHDRHGGLDRSCPRPPGRRADPVITAVGDIACQSYSQSDGEGACRSDEVAALITRASRPIGSWPWATSSTTTASSTEFLRVYDKQFGHLKPDHGAGAGQPRVRDRRRRRATSTTSGRRRTAREGYYSFDLGAWHIVSLNSDICRDDPGCGPGTPQYDWLASGPGRERTPCARSRSSTTPCSTGARGRSSWTPDYPTTERRVGERDVPRPLWRLLDRDGVDVMLVGHNHIYHRWAPQHADGDARRRTGSGSSRSVPEDGRSTHSGRSHGPRTSWRCRTSRSVCCR